MDALKDALKQRRGKGVDLTIVLAPEFEEEKKKLEGKTDLAPSEGTYEGKKEGEEETHEEEELTESPEEKKMEEAVGEEEMMKHGIMHGASDYEISNLEKGREPKSLRDRVRAMLLSKKGNKEE